MRVLNFIAIIFCALNTVAQTSNLELWHKNPAKTWTEALPVERQSYSGCLFHGKTGNYAYI